MTRGPGAGPRVGFWHPASLIATWFGAGLVPKVPGTAGSLAALPFAWLIQWAFGPVGLALAALALFVLGWWASTIIVKGSEEPDPGRIVVDEVAGQWLTLVIAPLDPVFYALGFVLFRIADIWKPWPVGAIDRRVKGGIGVMLDDLFAGIYAGAILYLILTIVTAAKVM
jgi:phosphatidylglycerophosphatase A